MIEISISLPNVVRYAYHGTEAREQAVGQPFAADVKLWLQAEKAVRSDKLQDTIDYTKLHEKICDELQGPPVQLLEPLAYRIATHIMQDFTKVEKVRVRLSKPSARLRHLPQCAVVELLICRSSLVEQRI